MNKPILAYGSCTLSARGSQNLAVLPKRHDNIFSPSNTNIDNANGALDSSNSELENPEFNFDEEPHIHILFRMTEVLSYLATTDELRASCLTLAPN